MPWRRPFAPLSLLVRRLTHRTFKSSGSDYVIPLIVNNNHPWNISSLIFDDGFDQQVFGDRWIDSIESSVEQTCVINVARTCMFSIVFHVANNWMYLTFVCVYAHEWIVFAFIGIIMIKQTKTAQCFWCSSIYIYIVGANKILVLRCQGIEGINPQTVTR